MSCLKCSPSYCDKTRFSKLFEEKKWSMDVKNPLFSEIIRQDLPFDKALETILKTIKTHSNHNKKPY